MITNIKRNNTFISKTSKEQSFGRMYIVSEKTKTKGFCSPAREMAILKIFKNHIDEFQHNFSLETFETHCFDLKDKNILIQTPKAFAEEKKYYVSTNNIKCARLKLHYDNLPQYVVKNDLSKNRFYTITEDANNSSILREIITGLAAKFDPKNVMDYLYYAIKE